ncbi:MAG: exodeoxyribonuclease III [Deltaproteobacteria bacterium]|nr:exodeoxyribonuclease III [Deltaproteobacteria bacterium]MDQ3296842.1 exodeoxyribonuclease III [Myxococcota bacterium]
MKVATWNVNGIRKRFTEVISWIDREEPDVVCLQETKASPDQVPEPLCSTAGYHCHWHGGMKGYSGVALMLRGKTFGDAPTFVHPPFDLENRIVVAEVGSLVLGSVYVPNGGKDFPAKMQFLTEMEAWAGELHATGKHLVLCGDFNVARTPIDVHPVLRKEMIGQSPPERALFEKFLAHGLVDVGRHVDPDNDRLFTWWAPWRNMRQRNIGWRLDYVAASRALVDETVHCVAYRDVGTSDHGPVIAHLRDAPVTV